MVFQGIAEHITQVVPECVMNVQQHENAVFPFWAVATFTSASQEGDIDVSVQCKVSGDRLLIWADIARESGMVLSESAVIPILTESPARESEILQAFSQMEGYVKTQTEIICHEVR
jgi:hypothetical protein